MQGRIAQAFGEVTLTPTTFIIDKRGKIIKRILGEPDFAQLDRLIEEKLAVPVGA
jgi:protein-disulfide isomerase